MNTWELPIPEFDLSNEKHLELTHLGEECTKKVSKLLAKERSAKSIGNLRRIIRGELESEINEINKIVKKILKI